MSKQRSAWALPYGYWQCRSGRLVLFNRRYKPILERQGRGKKLTVLPANVNERVQDIEREFWFYRDGTSPTNNRTTRKKIREALADFVEGRPLSQHVVSSLDHESGSSS